MPPARRRREEGARVGRREQLAAELLSRQVAPRSPSARHVGGGREQLPGAAERRCGQDVTTSRRLYAGAAATAASSASTNVAATARNIAGASGDLPPAGGAERRPSKAADAAGRTRHHDVAGDAPRSRRRRQLERTERGAVCVAEREYRRASEQFQGRAAATARPPGRRSAARTSADSGSCSNNAIVGSVFPRAERRSASAPAAQAAATRRRARRGSRPLATAWRRQGAAARGASSGEVQRGRVRPDRGWPSSGASRASSRTTRTSQALAAVGGADRARRRGSLRDGDDAARSLRRRRRQGAAVIRWCMRRFRSSPSWIGCAPGSTCRGEMRCAAKPAPRWRQAPRRRDRGPTARHDRTDGLGSRAARVAVVGGGPSGLTAALVAHREGANVTLIEKRDFHYSRPVWFDLEPGDDGERRRRRSCARGASSSCVRRSCPTTRAHRSSPCSASSSNASSRSPLPSRRDDARRPSSAACAPTTTASSPSPRTAAAPTAMTSGSAGGAARRRAAARAQLHRRRPPRRDRAV